jgi:cytochrome c oxidase cbb3-type subunit 2
MIPWRAWCTATALAALLGCRGTAPPEPPPPSKDATAPAVEERYGRPPLWSQEPVPTAPTPSQELLDLGERLYGWNCFPCHGAEGKGDGPVAQRQGLHPRDFTRGLFKLKSSAPGDMPFDEDLYRTIAVGIPLGGMPRNQNLEARDRWALVAYVKSLAVLVKADGTRDAHFETKAPARTGSLPPAPVHLDPARGRELFTSTVGCAACHGAGGKGDGPAAPELRDAWERPAPPPDLSRGELGLKGGSRLEDVFRVLTIGMAGTPMPSFAALPERDRWDLAAFIRSLFEPISSGEKIFLGAGCLACHTVGKGKLVGPDLIDVRGRRDRAWLRRWLADPPDMLARDAAVRKEFVEYKVQMPNLNLNGPEIEALIDYLENLRPRR